MTRCQYSSFSEVILFPDRCAETDKLYRCRHYRRQRDGGAAPLRTEEHQIAVFQLATLNGRRVTQVIHLSFAVRGYGSSLNL